MVATQSNRAEREQPRTLAELAGGPAPAGGAGSGIASVNADSGSAGGVDRRVIGEQLYHGAAQCASCHQPDGMGIPGAYPPLAGSPWVTGDPDRLIRVALHGVGGQIEIRGESYDSEMPGRGLFLDDDQMAATLTYVRQAWGNAAGPVSADQVRALRDAHAGRREVWPADQLMPVENRSPLIDLRYRVIDLAGDPGDVSTLEFAERDLVAEGAPADGFIDVGQVARARAKANAENALIADDDQRRQRAFAVAYEAEFEVPRADLYTYRVESRGRMSLSVDREVLIVGGEFENERFQGRSGKASYPRNPPPRDPLRLLGRVDRLAGNRPGRECPRPPTSTHQRRVRVTLMFGGRPPGGGGREGTVGFRLCGTRPWRRAAPASAGLEKSGGDPAFTHLRPDLLAAAWAVADVLGGGGRAVDAAVGRAAAPADGEPRPRGPGG